MRIVQRREEECLQIYDTAEDTCSLGGFSESMAESCGKDINEVLAS